MNQIATAKQHSLKIVLFFILAIGEIALSCDAGAANNISATFSVSVVVPITIAKAADFNFGSFYAGSTAGTIDIDVNGKRSVTGGVLTVFGGAAPTAAKFDVIGGASTTYSICYPSGVTLSGPGTPMALTRISGMTDADGAATLAATSDLGVGGTQSIYLGGSIAVAAGQVAGVYTGNITATVSYN